MGTVLDYLFSGRIDPMVLTLGPLLLIVQVAALVATWRRVHAGIHMDEAEAIANGAPTLGLIILLALNPAFVGEPDSTLQLVAAWVVLVALYATWTYGSMGHPGRGGHIRGAR